VPARGGPQRERVPRPSVVHPLGPPPWAGRELADLHVDVARVRRALAAAAEPDSIDPRDAPGGRSAVLVAVFEDAGEAWLVFIRRAASLRRNAGDVAFPGGFQDDGEDIVTTALREAQEEIGLDPGAVEVIGELDHAITVSSIEMVPIVGLLPGRPANLAISPDEVDAVLSVSVAELLVVDHHRAEHWGEGKVMYEFDLAEDTIWGASARILHRFLEVVLDVP
jgi:8-oxo-dGTP pyrophosphatase MutT (NUDIX family)